MKLRFKEAKMGYSKAEVDTHIMKLQNEIEEYRFHEAAKDKKLAELKLKEIEMKKIAQLKAEQIEQDAYDALYDVELGIQKGLAELAKIQKMTTEMFQQALIDFKPTDVTSANKYLEDMDYELTRKLYYLKSLPSDNEEEKKANITKTTSSDKIDEKMLSFESRTILQRKNKKKYGRRIALLLFTMFIICIIFYIFQHRKTEVSISSIELFEALKDELSADIEIKNEVIIDGYLEPVEVIESASIRVLEPIYTRKITETESELLQISKKVNPDFVFWLKINNTYLNCPVVQSDDNEFYLNHSFDQSENNLGTVFMDSAHHPLELGQNTFLYAKAQNKDALFHSLLQSETDIETIYTIFEDGVVIWEVFHDDSKILPTDKILSLIPADADSKYILKAKLKKP